MPQSQIYYKISSKPKNRSYIFLRCLSTILHGGQAFTDTSRYQKVINYYICQNAVFRSQRIPTDNNI
jgi:hypothetical protein